MQSRALTKRWKVGDHHFVGSGLDERVQLGLFVSGPLVQWVLRLEVLIGLPVLHVVCAVGDLLRGNIVKDRTLDQSNATVLVFTGALFPAPGDADLDCEVTTKTPVNANCGCVQNIMRLGDPRSPSDIDQHHLLFTPFCKTFTAESRLYGQTFWQSVSCVCVEDPHHGEYHWIFNGLPKMTHLRCSSTLSVCLCGDI